MSLRMVADTMGIKLDVCSIIHGTRQLLIVAGYPMPNDEVTSAQI